MDWDLEFKNPKNNPNYYELDLKLNHLKGYTPKKYIKQKHNQKKKTSCNKICNVTPHFS